MMIPGIDVDNMKRKATYAMWIYPSEMSVYGICSFCDGWRFDKPTKYCPNCGAIMVNAAAAQEHYGKLLDSFKADEEAEDDSND